MAAAAQRPDRTPEQVCLLGLYAVGASLLSMSQSSFAPSRPTSPSVAEHKPQALRFETPASPLKPKKIHTTVRTRKGPLRRSIEEHSVRPELCYLQPTKAKVSRAGSFDLLSRNAPMPPPRSPMLLNEFSFNASKLGIAGQALEMEAPPSPLSRHLDFGDVFGLGSPYVPKQSLAEQIGAADSKSQKIAWRPSFSMSPRQRDIRSGSVPEAGLASQDKMRSRSMSLDVPRRLARGVAQYVRPDKDSSTMMRSSASSGFPPQQDDVFGFASGRYWEQNGMMMSNLPRDSTSSSESEYDDEYDRRHSISGSSGHEGLHARARGHSDGSYSSTAPSTVTDSMPMSTFSTSDSHDSREEDEMEEEDEDDIEWEDPSMRERTCISPVFFDAHAPAPALPQNGASYLRPTMQSFASYSKPAMAKEEPRTPPKKSFGTAMLFRRGPRKMTSSSSLGGKSTDSSESFSSRARRSFSQARTLLTFSPPRSSTADAQPAAVFLQPINTGIISRPCQTTPNPISASTRSNSFSGSMTTNTNEAGSMRIPSFYLATSSEETGSVTGGSSGASSTSRSGRSWESIAPELAALEELVLTEAKFLSDLQLLLDVYVEGLKRMDLITPTSLDKIVSNLDEVMAFSKYLIDSVRSFLPQRPSPATSISSQPSNPDCQVGRIKINDEANAPDYLRLSSKLVRELPARMEVFARYCMNYQGAKERLEFERQLRPAVATFIELSKSTNPTLQGMDMHQFLVLPVQRVTRYPLLFGCLAKHCDKRRDEGNEIREEDEDATTSDNGTHGDALQLRQDRNKVIHDNWIRLRDASSSICQITNLAVSYQQSPARGDMAKTRGPRPSISSPIMTATATPPPPAIVMREPPVPSAKEQTPRSRSTSFSLAAMTKRRGSARTEENSSPDSLQCDGSSGSSSLLGKLLKPFRHPTPTTTY